MSNALPYTSAARRTAQFALLAATLVAALRLVQLAVGPTAGVTERLPAQGTAVADAELAKLYSHCPMAAVVDLETVATKPAQVDAILPPYRATADRVPAPTTDANIPRIQYPVTVRAPVPANGTSNPVRIAQLPQRDAAAPANTLAPATPGANPADDWLIDPHEWFTPEEQHERDQPQSQPDTTAPGVQPSETARPFRGPSPTGGNWKLLTPEDLEPSAPQPATAPGSTTATPQPDAAAPEPVPSQPADATETTQPLEPEAPQPTTDAPPRVDPGPPTSGDPATELFSAPDLNSPATTDAVESAPATVAPTDETPADDVPPAEVSESNASTNDAQAIDAPAPTPAATSPVLDEPSPSTPTFDPPALPAETLPTETSPAASPESPAPSQPLIAPPPLRTDDSLTPREQITSPVEKSPPAESPSSLFSPPTESHSPVVNNQDPAGAPTFGPPPSAPPAAPPSGADKNVDPHLDLFARNNYPSARECAACHEEIYHEWSVSAHAYAAVSPMFNKFEQKLNELTQGTVGYFCMRCHAPVATALCADRTEPLWNLPEVAREGITCIACHRVQYVYGKSNGERRIEPGNVFAPVMGGIGGDGVAETIHRKEHFKVKTSPDEKGPGQNIHVAGIYFDPLTRSEFCTPCHQVAVHPGIKLEVVWEQYRASPACKKGIQCQDCHMGRVPGLPLGYNVGPVAKMSDKTVNDGRKKSNHIFYGPNYSIAHPGVFPFHLKANRWTMQEWLVFDWRAGWGTDEFEDRVADGLVQVNFPPVWAESDDRYDAREIIEDNLKKLNHKRDIRRVVMENGSHVDGPFFDSPLCRGQDVNLHYVITNTNEGHNLLTASLGAQPQFWANVVLVAPDGRRVWESGYTDSYGDLANIHSVDVRHGRAPYDWQLFNLQTMFLITGVKGTDREFYVPVNLDIDQLPFIRPGTQPIPNINHPPFIRMESQSLAPLGSRRVPYRIPGHLVQQPGVYRLSFRMRSRAEPIYFMQFCGATEEMQRSMNEWMIDVHPLTVEFVIR